MRSATHDSNALQVGQTIAGKYRVEGMLGSGGMGVVFSARHLDLDRLVAVKVMRPGLAEQAGALRRWLREVDLADRFGSDQACQVLDVGTLESGDPYIVMKYLDGGELKQLLALQSALSLALPLQVAPASVRKLPVRLLSTSSDRKAAERH